MVKSAQDGRIGVEYEKVEVGRDRGGQKRQELEKAEVRHYMSERGGDVVGVEKVGKGERVKVVFLSEILNIMGCDRVRGLEVSYLITPKEDGSGMPRRLIVVFTETVGGEKAFEVGELRVGIGNVQCVGVGFEENRVAASVKTVGLRGVWKYRRKTEEEEEAIEGMKERGEMERRVIQRLVVKVASEITKELRVETRRYTEIEEMDVRGDFLRQCKHKAEFVGRLGPMIVYRVCRSRER